MSSINVLDLPLLRQKPSYETLVTALEALTIAPSTWSTTEDVPVKEENTIATSRYLTSILSSPFDWLQDPTSEKSHGLMADEQKEVLWDLASQRMTERCGRSAQGEILRTWRLSATDEHPDLDIVIREPPLTGDNLGLKTWGTAWSIAQKLSYFRSQQLSHLLDQPKPQCFTTANGEIMSLHPEDSSTRPRILELGSGTGLLGLAAAATSGADVVVTDLDIIQENLEFNVRQNQSLLNRRGANVTWDILDWTDLDNALPNISDKRFEMIIVSDPLYDSHHPAFVASTIRRHIKADSSSRVLVAVPMRDTNTTKMAQELWSLMKKNAFALHAEGTEICRDDWANDGAEVRCWWGIWSPC